VTIALLGLLLAVQPAAPRAEDLGEYGLRMGAEAGIPEDACALSAPSARSGDPAAVSPESEDAPPGKGTKTATLLEHGRWVCAKEGVEPDDCQALPIAYRDGEARAAALSPFLTVPDRIPLVIIPPAPAAIAPNPPIPAEARAAGFAAPPPPVREPVIRYVAAPPPLDPAFRRIAPPPPVGPAFRYAGPPPVGSAFRTIVPPPPLDPALGFAGPPRLLPLPEVVFFDGPIAPEGRALRGFRDGPRGEFRGEAFTVDDRSARFLQDGPTGRCWRSVVFSRFPSYRFVTC
jgi:hypothetical protein